MKGMRGNEGVSTATLSGGELLLMTGDTVMRDTEKTKGLISSPVLAFLEKSAFRPPRSLHCSSSIVPSTPETKRSSI